MLGIVEKHLKTNAGLKLCTLVAYEKLGVNTATAIYFPGDRENGGVFKHAAMMATVASLKAAKTVQDEALAKRLAELAYFMIGRTLPYTAMDDPFRLKGNPRFCTQYNNSETGENIGPMLSGTASWLTLAVYEYFGMDIGKDALSFAPILPPEQDALRYSIQLADTLLKIGVISENSRFRADKDTSYLLDGVPVPPTVPRPRDGREHRLTIRL